MKSLFLSVTLICFFFFLSIEGKATDDEQYPDTGDELPEKNREELNHLNHLKPKYKGRKFAGQDVDFSNLASSFNPTNSKRFSKQVDTKPFSHRVPLQQSGERCYGVSQTTFEKIVEVISDTFSMLGDKLKSLMEYYRNKFSRFF